MALLSLRAELVMKRGWQRLHPYITSNAFVWETSGGDLGCLLACMEWHIVQTQQDDRESLIDVFCFSLGTI
jgi:hypothetical protein